MSPKPKKITNRLFQGDCVYNMQALAAEGVRPNLIFADPPYNFGQDYDAHDDKMDDASYLEWTQNWLREANNLLDDRGSMWIMIPDEYADDVGVFCKRDLELHRRGWIIWHYTFGQNCKAKFNRSHVHLHYFTKKKPLGRKLKKDEQEPFTFNRDGILVKSARQVMYKDKRAKKGGKVPDDTWALLKYQVEELLDPVGDTWMESRVCGTFKARKSVSPNQVPVPIMERIVLSCSNPGDTVLDPFGGTGTTAVACALHGRNSILIDKSKACIDTAKERVDEAKKEKKRLAKLASEQQEMFPNP